MVKNLLIQGLNEIMYHYYKIISNFAELSRKEQDGFLESIKEPLKDLRSILHEMGDIWLEYIEKNDNDMDINDFGFEMGILDRVFEIQIVITNLLDVLE